MSLIKPLDIQFTKNTLDSAARPLQVLDEAHRVCIMSVDEGRIPGVAPKFKTPSGFYRGFAKDGLHYEGGLPSRIFSAKESIDDFSDKVTDASRWVAAGGNSDLTEGGIDQFTDPPFGRRAFLEVTSIAAKVADRKGLMFFTPNGANSAVLSSRVTTVGEGAPLGPGITNSILLGIQQTGSDADYVFVGFMNTLSHPFCLVQGHVIGGAPTISGATVIPPGTLEASVSLEMNFTTGMYRGYHSYSPIAEDYTGGTWSPIGVAIAHPAGWPTVAVPRIHAEFPAMSPLSQRHSISDVRVEIGSDPWSGQQRASWWLEPLDGSRPVADSGVAQDCPDELLVVWERSSTGDNALTLIDVSTPADPLLWRRWRGLPQWHTDERNRDAFWSPGWMDADEGHVMMTRNTSTTEFGPPVAGTEAGEVWVVSLRWDTIVIFATTGLQRYPLLFDQTSGRVLRENGSWGSRFLYPPPTNQRTPFDNYEHMRQLPFKGTYKNIELEIATSAITYGVHGVQTFNDLYQMSYGIQETAATLPAALPCFAGSIALSEIAGSSYNRHLYQKDTTGTTLWDATDEGWVGVAMTHQRAMWWCQAVQEDPTLDLVGRLCRRNPSADAPDNESTAPYIEDSFFGAIDRVGGACINLFLAHDSFPTYEILSLGTGWEGDSWAYVMWFATTGLPSGTDRTYGHLAGSQTFVPVTPDLTLTAPLNIFPAWITYRHQITNADLDLCRISEARAEGEVTPQWLAYSKMLGAEVVNKNFSVIRGQQLNRHEFVLELDGRWTPPWNPGERFATSIDFTALQSTGLRLFIEAERRLFGYVEFRVQGQAALAPANIEVKAHLEWFTPGGGKTTQTQTVNPGGAAGANNAIVRLRIKRQGGGIQFFFFDEGAASFANILTVPNAPNSPVLYGIETLVSDAPGGPACATHWRIEGLTVAPGDDPLGGPFVRTVDFQSLPSNGASTQGCVMAKGAIPEGGTGSIVIAEGWPLPMMPPQR